MSLNNRTNALTRQPPSELALQNDAIAVLQDAQLRRRLVATCISQDMREGHDYGIIPGTENKALLKPGAEKLRSLFRLAPKFTLEESREDWDEGFFAYRVKCVVYDRSNTAWGEASAACNIKEKRYRDRTRAVAIWKATEEEKANAIRTETRTSKKGSEYQVYIVEDKDAGFDLQDTVYAIAQKRAFVRAINMATNASEFFKYEASDIDIIDVAAELVNEPTIVPGQSVQMPDQVDNSNGLFEIITHGQNDSNTLIEKERQQLWDAARAAGFSKGGFRNFLIGSNYDSSAAIPRSRLGDLLEKVSNKDLAEAWNNFQPEQEAV